MGLRNTRSGLVPQRKIDLQELALDLRDIFNVSDLTVHLFGSRKDQTGSTRSDVDLLVELPRRVCDQEKHAIWELEPYLDVFVLDRGVAESLVNESQLHAESDKDLINQLGAVSLMRDGNWIEAADKFRNQTVLAERNPAATQLPLYDLVDAVPAERADLLIVTALTEEYNAVLTALDKQTTEPSIVSTLEDDKGSPWKMRILNLHEMGSVGAALKTADAIRRSKPSHVILVGICAGIPGKSQLIDVVVPQSVIYYEPNKTTPEGIQGSYDTHNCNAEARKRISVLAGTFKDLMIRADGELMACGEKVIADASTRNALVESHRKLAAIDMESYGVLRAAESRGIPATVIKSVCDLADSTKSDSSHKEAQTAAAETLIRVVRAGAFRAEK